MGKKKYCVHLNADEREAFEQIVNSKKAARWKIKRTQAMLKCDQSPDAPSWPDTLIAEAYDVTWRPGANKPFYKAPYPY